MNSFLSLIKSIGWTEVIERKCLKRKKLQVKKSLGDTAFQGKEMNHPKWWLRRRKQTKQKQRDRGRRRRAAQLGVMPQSQKLNAARKGSRSAQSAWGTAAWKRPERCCAAGTRTPSAGSWKDTWEPGSDFFRTSCTEEGGGMQMWVCTRSGLCLSTQAL